jgi:Sperm tail
MSFFFYKASSASIGKMPPRKNRAARKIEAELRRKQQCRERLAREVKFASKSLVRGEPGWIETCSKLRLEELQRQFKYDLTRGQRLLDEKDSYIKKLLQVKAEATEFYDQRVRRHEQQMDFMIGECVALIDERLSL